MTITAVQAARRDTLGIGASEAAAAIGLSRYATPIDLFIRKRAALDGLAPAHDAPGEMAVMGNDIEEAILRRYERETGLKGFHSPDTMISPAYPWMFAHLDWLGDDRVVDAKLSGGTGFGEPGTDQVPQEVICQLHHQMIVSGRPFSQIAAFVISSYGRGRSGIEFAVYDIPYQEALGKAIIEGTRELWERVQRNDPPPAQSPADEIKLWTTSRPVEARANHHVNALVHEYRKYDRLARQMQCEADRLEVEIKAFMKDADTLIGLDGDVVATWKSGKPQARLDTTRLREELPEVAAQYIKVGAPSRRFLVKEIK